jgi:carbon storage regulator CsrA
MLILTRGIEEATTITTPSGEEITVKVMGFPNRNAVRLGFQAPQNFKILRDNARLKEEIKGASS